MPHLFTGPVKATSSAAGAAAIEGIVIGLRARVERLWSRWISDRDTPVIAYDDVA
jgi:hypothetical protein